MVLNQHKFSKFMFILKCHSEYQNQFAKAYFHNYMRFGDIQCEMFTLEPLFLSVSLEGDQFQGNAMAGRDEVVEKLYIIFFQEAQKVHGRKWYLQ